jgi:type VI secretion system FHA domain protein
MPALALPSAVPMPPPASSIPGPALAMVMPLPRSTNTAPALPAPAKPLMPVVAMPSELQPELLADLTELPQVGPEAAGAAIPVPRRASRPPRQPSQGDIPDLAFWRGLGIEPDSLSPEERMAALEAFGRAMRTAADGLVALLGARRFVKSEVDLEQTQLAAADNNAFKFSPSGEAALRRLMENETGFTPVDLAVSRAFDDLRAHELGIAAGMKAALGAMLERLAPASIERRFAPIRGGLFTSRKARLWELYASLHSEIADGAESRFKDAFSRSFATAYDQRAREASRPGDD